MTRTDEVDKVWTSAIVGALIKYEINEQANRRGFKARLNV